MQRYKKLFLLKEGQTLLVADLRCSFTRPLSCANCTSSGMRFSSAGSAAAQYQSWTVWCCSATSAISSASLSNACAVLSRPTISCSALVRSTLSVSRAMRRSNSWHSCWSMLNSRRPMPRLMCRPASQTLGMCRPASQTLGMCRLASQTSGNSK